MELNAQDYNGTSALVVCENLVKIYKVADLEVVALQGLDLIVAPGELLGIVGASGSGKSTLLNILGGLDRPSAGRVWVDGKDLLRMATKDLNSYRRNTVGFVWQQSARNLIPYLRAYENVELPMTLSGKTGKEKKFRAKELIEAVGLGSRQNHYLSELSGGEQQRVAIAVSLANNPKLLLADEPTGEVDESTSKVIYETLKTLSRQFGVTILAVSHDPKLAKRVDRVVAIRDGKTAAETVRYTSSNNLTDKVSFEDETLYEELTVLDSAGRLQVPKDYLQQFNIKNRVRLEIVDNGILIKPVAVAEKEYLTEILPPGKEKTRISGRLKEKFTKLITRK